MKRRGTGWIPDYPDLSDYTLGKAQNKLGKSSNNLSDQVQSQGSTASIEFLAEKVSEALDFLTKQANALQLNQEEQNKLKDIQKNLNREIWGEVKFEPVIFHDLLKQGSINLELRRVLNIIATKILGFDPIGQVERTGEIDDLINIPGDSWDLSNLAGQYLQGRSKSSVHMELDQTAIAFSKAIIKSQLFFRFPENPISEDTINRDELKLLIELANELLEVPFSTPTLVRKWTSFFAENHLDPLSTILLDPHSPQGLIKNRNWYIINLLVLIDSANYLYLHLSDLRKKLGEKGKVLVEYFTVGSPNNIDSDLQQLDAELERFKGNLAGIKKGLMDIATPFFAGSFMGISPDHSYYNRFDYIVEIDRIMKGLQELEPWLKPIKKLLEQEVRPYLVNPDNSDDIKHEMASKFLHEIEDHSVFRWKEDFAGVRLSLMDALCKKISNSFLPQIPPNYFRLKKTEDIDSPLHGDLVMLLQRKLIGNESTVAGIVTELTKSCGSLEKSQAIIYDFLKPLLELIAVILMPLGSHHSNLSEAVEWAWKKVQDLLGEEDRQLSAEAELRKIAQEVLSQQSGSLERKITSVDLSYLKIIAQLAIQRISDTLRFRHDKDLQWEVEVERENSEPNGYFVLPSGCGLVKLMNQITRKVCIDLVLNDSALAPNDSLDFDVSNLRIDRLESFPSTSEPDSNHAISSMGDYLKRYIHPDDRDDFQNWIRDGLKSGAEYPFFCRGIERQDGAFPCHQGRLVRVKPHNVESNTVGPASFRYSAIESTFLFNSTDIERQKLSKLYQPVFQYKVKTEEKDLAGYSEMYSQVQFPMSSRLRDAIDSQFPQASSHAETLEAYEPLPDEGVYLTLPECVDLSYDFSSVEDQGNLNACTAYAGIALIEYAQRKSFGAYIDVSPLFLYKVSRNLMQQEGDAGASMRDTMKAMVAFGVCPEVNWPYDEAKFDQDPPAFCYAFAENYKALKYFRLDHGTIPRAVLLAQIKALLVSEIPCAFGFTLYDSAYEESNFQRGHLPLPTQRDKVIGGHVVVAVGYHDRKIIKNSNGDEFAGALLIRNSWGKEWGQGGYGWMPYDYVLKGLTADWWSLLKAEWLTSGNFGAGASAWTRDGGTNRGGGQKPPRRRQ